MVDKINELFSKRATHRTIWHLLWKAGQKAKINLKKFKKLNMQFNAQQNSALYSELS